MTHSSYSLRYLTKDSPRAIKAMIDSCPSLYGISQRFNAEAGGDIYEACRIAIAVARIIGANVVFEFNKVLVTVHQDDDLILLTTWWHETCYGGAWEFTRQSGWKRIKNANS